MLERAAALAAGAVRVGAALRARTIAADLAAGALGVVRAAARAHVAGVRRRAAALAADAVCIGAALRARIVAADLAAGALPVVRATARGHGALMDRRAAALAASAVRVGAALGTRAVAADLAAGALPVARATARGPTALMDRRGAALAAGAVRVGAALGTRAIAADVAASALSIVRASARGHTARVGRVAARASGAVRVCAALGTATAAADFAAGALPVVRATARDHAARVGRRVATRASRAVSVGAAVAWQADGDKRYSHVCAGAGVGRRGVGRPPVGPRVEAGLTTVRTSGAQGDEHEPCTRRADDTSHGVRRGHEAVEGAFCAASPPVARSGDAHRGIGVSRQPGAETSSAAALMSAFSRIRFGAPWRTTFSIARPIFSVVVT